MIAFLRTLRFNTSNDYFLMQYNTISKSIKKTFKMMYV
jgi:hypothetical protein